MLCCPEEVIVHSTGCIIVLARSLSNFLQPMLLAIVLYNTAPGVRSLVRADRALRTRSRNTMLSHLLQWVQKGTSPEGWRLVVTIQIGIYSIYSCLGAFLIIPIIGIMVKINSMLKATTNHSCKFDGHGQISCITILENHIRIKNA